MDRDALLEETKDGKVFGVEFVKRTTGEVRHMLARRGVKAYLKGGKLPYEPKDHNLVVVFDMNKLAFRTIPADAVLVLRAHGHTVFQDPRAAEIKAAHKSAGKA